MKLRPATAEEPLSGPARVCNQCKHAAHLHREVRENGKGYVHNATSCIGDGPGFACPCKWSCEYVNAANLVIDEVPDRRLQLVVVHKGNLIRYYPLSEAGWKVDTETRQIVIGLGVPRTWIPLDNLLSYGIEEC